MWYQQKVKYVDSKSSVYLRGTWLKTKQKYQTVILAYLWYVSTRIIAHWWLVKGEVYLSYKTGKVQILFVCMGQQRKLVKVIWALACGWSAIHCCNSYNILAIVAVRKPKTCHTNFLVRTDVQLTRRTCYMKLAGMDLLEGGGGYFFVIKQKNVRDKRRLCNLSNNMMISELWTTITIQIQ